VHSTWLKTVTDDSSFFEMNEAAGGKKYSSKSIFLEKVKKCLHYDTYTAYMYAVHV